MPFTLGLPTGFAISLISCPRTFNSSFVAPLIFLSTTYSLHLFFFFHKTPKNTAQLSLGRVDLLSMVQVTHPVSSTFRGHHATRTISYGSRTVVSAKYTQNDRLKLSVARMSTTSFRVWSKHCIKHHNSPLSAYKSASSVLVEDP